jgi:hypothetical protein
MDLRCDESDRFHRIAGSRQARRDAVERTLQFNPAQPTTLRSVTREVVVLSLARLQLSDLAEPIPGIDPSAPRSWKAKV